MVDQHDPKIEGQTLPAEGQQSPLETLLAVLDQARDSLAGLSNTRADNQDQAVEFAMFDIIRLLGDLSTFGYALFAEPVPADVENWREQMNEAEGACMDIWRRLAHEAYAKHR